MAKKDNLRLDVNSLPVAPVTEPEKANAKNAKDKGKGKNQKKEKRPRRLVNAFKGMISELKKVEWPSFKRTKNQSGVIAQTGTVLIVVLFFLICIAAFDSGLLALLRLLVSK